MDATTAQVAVAVFVPDLTHPYQIGRHGGARKEPAGLSAGERREWLFRYDEGAATQKIIRAHIAGLSPTATAPPLVAEWHRNRRLMNLDGTQQRKEPYNGAQRTLAEALAERTEQ